MKGKKYNFVKGYDRDNFKLRFVSEPKFHVNEKKGVVVCRLQADLVSPRGNYDSPYVQHAFANCVGVARCNEHDKFDVNRGKRIALARAENQCYMEAASYLEENRQKLLFLAEAIGEFIDKGYECCAHNDDYIDSLSYQAHPYYKKEVTPFKKGVEVSHIKV